MSRRPSDPPVIGPRNGLRQRELSGGRWRVWWEPTPRQRKLGAKPVELSADKPGEAQRRADALVRQWAAKGKAAAPAPVAAGQTVSAVIADYRASRFFTRLRDSTRASYGWNLSPIEAHWGPQPIAYFDAPVMLAWYETLLETKGEWRARAIILMFSILMLHAEKRGWRPKGSNPCRDLDMDRPAGRVRSGTWEELDACLKAARSLRLRSIRTALLLAIHTGQRQYDLTAAMPGDFECLTLQLPGMAAPQPRWVWTVKRSKRGNASAILIHPAAVPALRVARLVAQAAGDAMPLIHDERTGQPYSKRLFFDRWAEVRALAAASVPSVATLQWRDLRRTFGRFARAGGASKGDVADVLGNTADTDAYLGGIYMAASIETTARAIAAVQKPERKKA